jgi:transcriptional regulator with PAS, ATPase and Fis domain
MEVSLLKKKQAHLTSVIEQDLTVCQCQSVVMKELDHLINKVASTEASVLILGENGTGKEVIAREIHRRSHRSGEIFVKVDLGAIPESLFESELFGHRKGAFTDARNDRDGRFIIASGGTLFLDEIGNLPPELQVKLLSVIQNRELYPVGSPVPVPVDVRIISATNMPMRDMIEKRRFREDLLYRINAIQIDVPPLRERTDDIPVLAQFFLRKYCHQYSKPMLKLDARSLKSLQAHSWPGNIRELEHTIEKAVILSEEKVINDAQLFPKNASSTSTHKPVSHNLEENEKILIDSALRKEHGNVSAAAKKLGINRSTLYQKMKKYGI